MFERYTEKARRVIFFARYEASQFGSHYIETEHLLLGILREQKALIQRIIPSDASIDLIQKQIEDRTTIREKVFISVDLPLSNESKGVLAYASEEAQNLSHTYIGTEHLLLGMMREEKSLAATILSEIGLKLPVLRGQMSQLGQEEHFRSAQQNLYTDLTEAAEAGTCFPVIGRDKEIERLIQVLCRRFNGNPVLIGEAGVGKEAIVAGLVQRIADGNVPPKLQDKRVLAVDLAELVAKESDTDRIKEMQRKAFGPRVILFVEDLHSGTFEHNAHAVVQFKANLEVSLARSKVQCISCATNRQFVESIKAQSWVEERFRIVHVPSMSEVEAGAVLLGIKNEYEAFHNVKFPDDVLGYLILCANRFVHERKLPGKAIDLMDEVGAMVAIRERPAEIVAAQKNVAAIVREMERAIMNHEFEKARHFSDEEAKARQLLANERAKHELDEVASCVVSRDHVDRAISAATGISMPSIRNFLAGETKGV